MKGDSGRADVVLLNDHGLEERLDVVLRAAPDVRRPSNLPSAYPMSNVPVFLVPNETLPSMSPAVNVSLC